MTRAPAGASPTETSSTLIAPDATPRLAAKARRPRCPPRFLDEWTLTGELRAARSDFLTNATQTGELLAVLLVAYVLKPVDHLTIETFLNGDVGHSCRWRGAMPVLHARREPDHIARMDFFDVAALLLDPAATCRDEERLPQGVRVPCRAGTRLECDTGRRSTPPGRLAETAGQCGPRR